MVERLGVQPTSLISKISKKVDISYACFKTRSIDTQLEFIFNIHDHNKNIDE